MACFFVNWIIISFECQRGNIFGYWGHYSLFTFVVWRPSVSNFPQTPNQEAILLPLSPVHVPVVLYCGNPKSIPYQSKQTYRISVCNGPAWALFLFTFAAWKNPLCAHLFILAFSFYFLELSKRSLLITPHFL